MHADLSREMRNDVGTVTRETLSAQVEKLRGEKACPKCSKPMFWTGRNWRCRPCHAALTRKSRKANAQNPEQRSKAMARAIAGAHKRRGKLQQQPCEKCGTHESQMHHDDYSKPLEVQWLCRKCHMDGHKSPRSGLCPCGKEQIVNGQGYGPKCHAEAQKRYRKKIKAELEFYRKHTGKHRNGAQS
jgi:hypothetical protein